jgi:hypothetical protein
MNMAITPEILMGPYFGLRNLLLPIKRCKYFAGYMRCSDVDSGNT